MNQILVSEKLYVTPELRKKKKMYKINLIVSIVLVVVLGIVAICIGYDRAQKENISQQILAGMSRIKNNNKNDTTTINDDNVWVIALNGDDSLYNAKAKDDVHTVVDKSNEETEKQNSEYGIYTDSDGTRYYTVGSISIPKIGIEYPILADTSPSLLKISVCKFWGSNPNEEGNLCIAGHNYRNKRFFSKVPTLVVGDIIEITDLNERTEQYSVYDKYTVLPDDIDCTSQLTNGKTIVTLITCTNDNKQRYVIKAEKI